MKINNNYKVRNVAGENIILLQGQMGGDMTRVMAFNDTALFLWNELSGKDFTIDDAVKALTDQYEIDDSTARVDVEKWVQMLVEGGLMMDESQTQK